MKIDRRNLLWATAGLAMTTLVGPASCQASLASSNGFPWHPFTRSLLDRARQASSVNGRAHTALIERLIHQEVVTQGYANPPVIKWLADPFDAFAYLRRLGLEELLQMDTTRLWRRARPHMPIDEDRSNSAAVLGGWIAGLVRSAEHDSALMAPKLHSKVRVMAEDASAEAVFKVRAVGAQIGWLETCIPLVAAQAVTDVELLLSSGFSGEGIHHQLRVFEAYELGLLATWETTDVVICVPRTPVAGGGKTS
jgi:hypothetical protein